MTALADLDTVEGGLRQLGSPMHLKTHSEGASLSHGASSGPVCSVAGPSQQSRRGGMYLLVRVVLRVSGHQFGS